MNNLNEQILRAKELMGILNESSDASIHNLCMEKILEEKDFQTLRSILQAGHLGGGKAGSSGIGACGRHLYELMTDKTYATKAPTIKEIKEKDAGCDRAWSSGDDDYIQDSVWQKLILDNWSRWVECLNQEKDGKSSKEDVALTEGGCTCGFSAFIFRKIKPDTPECSKACSDYEEQLKADGKWNDDWQKNAGKSSLQVYEKNKERGGKYTTKIA